MKVRCWHVIKKFTARLAFSGIKYFPRCRNSFLLEWSIFISLCNQQCTNFHSQKHLSVGQDNSYSHENYPSLIKYECKVSEYFEIHTRKWCTNKFILEMQTWGERIKSSFFTKEDRGKGHSELISSWEVDIQEGSHRERGQNWWEAGATEHFAACISGWKDLLWFIWKGLNL